LLVYIIANKKFPYVLVRALIKSHVPGPLIGKFDARLKNVMQQRAQFYADCASILNRSCLTLYDVIHYNDVISVIGSYVFRRNMRFIGVQILKSFSVKHIDLQNFLNAPRRNLY